MKKNWMIIVVVLFSLQARAQASIIDSLDTHILADFKGCVKLQDDDEKAYRDCLFGIAWGGSLCDRVERMSQLPLSEDQDWFQGEGKQDTSARALYDFFRASSMPLARYCKSTAYVFEMPEGVQSSKSMDFCRPEMDDFQFGVAKLRVQLSVAQDKEWLKQADTIMSILDGLHRIASQKQDNACEKFRSTND